MREGGPRLGFGHHWLVVTVRRTGRTPTPSYFIPVVMLTEPEDSKNKTTWKRTMTSLLFTMIDALN